ncbi:hypothetical protein IAQ61_010052 [Plenodomus lingam]|nr:hypothetical protein IAQ61_010052 [Plenodomus lingam]
MTPQPPTIPFSTQLNLRRLNDTAFETTTTPQRMGNPQPIAYGGYALAVACKAASLTVPPDYHLYSMQGNFLGPASTNHQLRASVRTLRQTRTFATRQVEVSQVRDDGETRLCLIALADFQTPEQDVLLEYSRAPSRTYSAWSQCPTQLDAQQKLLAEGKVTQAQVDAHAKGFQLAQDLFEQRVCPEGIFAQTLHGMAKSLPHSQDGLALPQRTTADWFRSAERFADEVDNITSLTWIMDAAISFAPLAFSHLWFEDVGAASSLDFSLRFFRNRIDARRWHLRELSTKVGAEGRTYGESWVWDEEGRAVACMTQQSILRPRLKEGKEKKKKKDKGKL